MAPMVTNFATTDGEITDRQVTYYAERARGGVGIVIVEASAIHQAVRAFERQVGVYDDRFLPGLSLLAGAIKAEGVVTLLQLHHAGPKINPGIGLHPVSVSPVKIREGNLPHQLSIQELKEVRRDFVAAARRARSAGFDGVELHAAHFYLLSASISPYSNKRNDAYGGSTMNRARLTREIIEDIKGELGAGYPVWVRINGCEALEPGLDPDESRQVAGILAGAGADAVHVSAYTLQRDRTVKTGLSIPVGGGPFKDTPPGPYLDYAKVIKDAVDVPVVAVGKLDNPMLAEKSLAQGQCDMIALARQLLCDPYWVLKVQSDRAHEIVHCNYCETCHRALHDGKEIYCAQNRNLYGKPSYKKHPDG